MLPVEEQPELMQDIEKDNPTKEVEHVDILRKLLSDLLITVSNEELDATVRKDYDEVIRWRCYRTRITWNLGQLGSTDGRV